MCYFWGMRHLALLAAVALTTACSTESKPTSTPAPARTPTQAVATPVALPVDPASLPAAHRADAATLPQNVASSLAFIQMMLTEQRSTMDLVTCHCCNKTLAQCYLDTATKAAKACSPL